MIKRSLTLLQLYPRDMNIYGDWGNTLIIKKRAEWHGYDVKLVDYNQGDGLPEHIDIIVGGGGQDSGQTKIQTDLERIGPRLKDMADRDVPMLVVCGLYQLFGNFFKTKEGVVINGIGLFGIETHGGLERMIGNIIIESEKFGQIIGYENHSGQTYLGKNTKPFGIVRRGAGNNGQDETEGARYRHVIGTYLHGSLLPKNPAIADYLIEKAAMRRYGEFTPTVIDDRFATEARKVASKRPR